MNNEKFLCKGIYKELIGDKASSLKYYTEVLKNDIHNKKAKSSIRRLSGIYKSFDNVNKEKLEEFVNINSDNEILEFEKWLLKTQI